MDFQRLILFVIFSMSGVFLFQAWQKENAPPKPPVAITAPATPTAAPDKKNDIPPGAAARSAAASTTAATTGSARRPLAPLQMAN